MPPAKTPKANLSKPTVPQSPMQEAFTWIWKTFGEQIITWSWKAAQWKLAANRYSEYLAKDYGKLFVLGQPEPKDIDDIYTYVNVLEKVSAFKRYGPEQLHAFFMGRGLWHEEKERRDGVKMVGTGKNLFILGQPGAGKTTFLKQVTIRAAQGKMIRAIDNQLRNWLPEVVQEKLKETKEVAQIPVFISLKAHADAGRTLFESVAHELQVCRFPEAKPFVELLLKSGRALVLWDGLDEVSQDGGRRDKLTGAMREFMRQYRETQFVITCRVAAAEYSFDNVDYLEMADFDEGQMNTFIHRWFDDRKLADQCWEELRKEENQGLRELARIPLLLTLLAITYEETLTFPQRRVEIYEEAIDALLKKWDSKRRIRRGDELYKALSLGRKRQMLARIGAETFGNGEFILPQRRLAELIEAFMRKLPGAEEDIDGAAVLRSIAARHGIFVERAKNLYSFAHLSFQEYFAAKFIVDNTRQDSLERLLDHIDESQWRELFLLTASLLNEADADDFFGMFLARLNGMAAQVEPVQQYLAWAQEKGEQAARAMNPAYRPVSLRAWYLAVARVLNRDLDPDIGIGLEFDDALTLAFELDRDLELDRYLAFNLVPDLAFSGFSRSDILCEELGLTELGERLVQLKRPTAQSLQEDWEAFAQELKTVIDAFRDLSGVAYLRQWGEEDKCFAQSVQWDRAQLNTYARHIKGTALLIDCLQLAAISDRAGIEERLLLPASAN